MKLKCVVDLGAIRDNLAAIKRKAATAVMLMVKADAYGHGLAEVALATRDIADMFGVATVEEGEALRAAGIKNDILLLMCAPDELARASEIGLTVGIHDFCQIDRLERDASAGLLDAATLKIHIKTDTGMHRLGFDEVQLGEALARLKGLDANVLGVYSHMRVRSYGQLNAFHGMCCAVRKFYPDALRHIAASGSLDASAFRLDMVRAGICAYRGAMSVKSRVVTARRVGAGEHISYGNFKTERPLNAAIVFGGYADGVRREFPSDVYIRGRACRVLGRVCMDMFAVETEGFMAESGEEVVIFDAKTLGQTAKQRRTTAYTVLTGWHGRIERTYEQGGGAENS